MNPYSFFSFEVEAPDPGTAWKQLCEKTYAEYSIKVNKNIPTKVSDGHLANRMRNYRNSMPECVDEFGKDSIVNYLTKAIKKCDAPKDEWNHKRELENRRGHLRKRIMKVSKIRSNELSKMAMALYANGIYEFHPNCAPFYYTIERGKKYLLFGAYNSGKKTGMAYSSGELDGDEDSERGTDY